MKLVEVVRGNDTSDEAYDALFQFCQKLGKSPVKCADSPGFIVNRLLIPYLADAMRLAESGNASPRDIDTAMRLGTGGIKNGIILIINNFELKDIQWDHLN
jgi:3-hydroxyacyl-CoA dehydrogenase